MVKSKSRNYLTRNPADKPGQVALPDGRMIEVIPCRLTVSRLANGQFRCYQCSIMKAIENASTHAIHWTATGMVFHVLEHWLDRDEVIDPRGLKRLVEEAIRNG